MGLIAPQYQTEPAARQYLESKLWPDGPVCPHCAVIGESTKLDREEGAEFHGRKGLYQCNGCRKQFTITVGTIFEDSKIPLHKWLLAVHLMCSSKKGVSALQLQRELELGSYRSAWFMCHRIRWAMSQEPMKGLLEGIVEVDETYIGGKLRTGRRTQLEPGEIREKRKSALDNKAAVVSILKRGGDVHSVHVERVTSANLREIIDQTVAPNAHLMTDTSTPLKSAGKGRKHDKVNHSADEYVRYEDGTCITTNGIESFFALIKRGNYGIFHHWGRQYTDQYLREFDFRYNGRKLNDGERTDAALRATRGKRLMLKEPKGA